MRKSPEGVLTLPAVAVSVLPKVVCPVCWPTYAAFLSAVGLGFLATKYLLPVTAGFLALAVAALAFRASDRRGFGPMGVGVLAAACVLSGKFWVGSDSTSYAGVGLLFVASIWNAIPKRRTPEVCPACLPTAPRSTN